MQVVVEVLVHKVDQLLRVVLVVLVVVDLEMLLEIMLDHLAQQILAVEVAAVDKIQHPLVLVDLES
jgi:hypothetical protein